MVSWHDFFKEELETSYIKELQSFLAQERSLYPVYPPSDQIFSAMHKTPLDAVKVVILGQDPYHGPGQAMGLSFSVPEGVPPPPSLKNIYKEIVSDLNISMNQTKGDLTPWADQGVLLLNTLLTVREATPLSHKDRGWEIFTDHLLEFLLTKGSEMVFLLWGKPAQDKILKRSDLVKDEKHLILKAPHPSPLSAHRGFLGCRHFSKANEWLEQKGISPIDWQIR